MNEKIRAIKNKAEKDFYFFCKEILGYSKMSESPHRDLCEHLLKPGKRKKLTLMPRGSFKSSIGAVGLAIWEIVHNPNIRILIASETQKNAVKYVKEIRAHFEGNEKLKSLFGDFVSLDNTWRDNEFIVGKRNKIYKEPTIMASSLEKGTIVGLHFDCLHPSTEVLTSYGLVKSKDLKINDRVMGVDGKFHKIKAKVSKQTNKRLVSIRPKYQCTASVFTEDHKIWAFKDGKFQWANAGDLSAKDYLAIPKMPIVNARKIAHDNPRIVSLLGNKNIWRLIGYWLGDGARTQDGYGVRITVGSHEKELIEDIVSIVKEELQARVGVHKTKSNSAQIVFADKDMKLILSKFGEYAWNKFIPPFALSALYHHRVELIKGYFETDGCINNKNKDVSFVSTSKQMLLGIQLILASLDIQSSLKKTRRAGKSIIVGVKCKTRAAYQLNSTSHLLHLLLGLDAEFPIRPTRSFFTNEFWCVPISKLATKPAIRQEVIDIQVEDAESFYCQGLIAHNCIILDDVVSRNNINSTDQIQKTLDYYRLLLSILEPTGRIFINGTRWSVFDLYGWILDENAQEIDQFHVIQRKAIEDGRLLMPNVLTRTFLEEQRRTQGEGVFQSQYQNDPISSDVQTFKQEHVKIYEENPPGLIYFMTVDPAVSTKSEGDYSGIIVNGVDYEHRWFIQEAIQVKLDPNELVELIFQLVEKYQPMMCLGLEQFMLEKFLRVTLLQEQEKRNLYFPLKELQTSNKISKAARIRALQPRFENSQIFIKKEHKDLAFQITYHPQLKHDDILDALKSQIQITFPSDYKVPVEERKYPSLDPASARVWDNLAKYDQPRRKVKRSKWTHNL